MSEIAGWVAPIATMIAAMMTAANLGTRITGWGFVIFAIGSVAWIIIAISTEQSNLLFTNAFLSAVNVVGIWRWLGRQAKHDDGARAASKASAHSSAAALFQLGGMQGWKVIDLEGEKIGEVIDGMAECATGQISYLVIREGDVATMRERLHAVPWTDVRVEETEIHLTMKGADFQNLPVLEPDAWPASA